MTNKPTVTLYSQPGCGPCVGVERALTAAKVPFEVRDIRSDEAAYQRIKELGYMGTPVVEHPGGHFHGYNPEEVSAIAAALF